MTEKIHTINIKQDLDEVFLFLEGIYPIEEKTIIAISGGADSMLAATTLYQFWTKRNRDINKLHFIYCDHQVRKHNDIRAIQSYIGEINLTIVTRGKNKKNTENDLRKRRYKAINAYANEVGANILITGHHLSDRIESSFLNMLRGCSIDGFMSMQRIDRESAMFNGTVIRPLLSISKRYITHICKKYRISYVEDTTNKDTTISKRNKLRHDIISPLLLLANKNTDEENSFERSMQYIYTSLELSGKSTNSTLQTIPLCKHRKAKWGYKRSITKKEIDTHQVKKILKTLKISNNTSQKNIKDITDFLREKSSGYKHINKTYFFISHGTIYIIYGPKKFRENKVKKVPQNINKLFDSDVVKKEIINRRLPSNNEKIHGKNRNKRCINQKIPIFWRTCIPLVSDKNNAIKPYIFDFLKTK